MRKLERTSMMRVMVEMVKANAVIDGREVRMLTSLQKKYGISHEDEVEVETMTLSRAISVLKSFSEDLRNQLIGDLTHIALSDHFCSKEEALLLVSVISCLTDRCGVDATVVSVTASDIHLNSDQLLYVESAYDAETNRSMKVHYREMALEARLLGFELIYLPVIAERCRSVSDGQLRDILSFLYPQASECKITCVLRGLQQLSTSMLCKEELAGRSKIQELFDVQPSLLIKIGESEVNSQRQANFLILGLDGNVMKTFQQFIDIFSDFYKSRALSNLQVDRNRFLYTGFYKQILDLYVYQCGVRSSVLVDAVREEIVFPEVDLKLEKLHRREKALYTLFLSETAHGGINFNKPGNIGNQERYLQRIRSIQKKYNLIYEKFGGDRLKAPQLEKPEIRLPMMSLIKRQVLQLGDRLCHVDDYVIQRNVYGTYEVRLDPDLCLYRRLEDSRAIKLAEALP